MPSVPKCDIVFSTDITYFCEQILFNCCLFLLIQIQTFYSDTDISFGYRHFIRIRTFYSNRHFIRIQTFYSNADILFRYRHFIRIQTFYSDTNVLFRYRLFGYIVMLRARMFRSLIVRTGIKEQNIRARNITI